MSEHKVDIFTAEYLDFSGCRYCTEQGEHECSFFFPYTKQKTFNVLEIELALRFALLFRVIPKHHIYILASLTDKELKAYQQIYLNDNPLFAEFVARDIGNYLGNSFKLTKQEMMMVKLSSSKLRLIQKECKRIKKVLAL